MLDFSAAEDRLIAMPSISSMNSIHGALSRAYLKVSRTLRAPIPTYISTNSDPVVEIKFTPASPAVALASSVLPVPEGPYIRMPFGSFAPTALYLSGSRK